MVPAVHTQLRLEGVLNLLRIKFSGCKRFGNRRFLMPCVRVFEGRNKSCDRTRCLRRRIVWIGPLCCPFGDRAVHRCINHDWQTQMSIFNQLAWKAGANPRHRVARVGVGNEQPSGVFREEGKRISIVAKGFAPYYWFFLA